MYTRENRDILVALNCGYQFAAHMGGNTFALHNEAHALT